MKVTLSLDDDVIQIIRDYAALKYLRLGKAASELIRKGVEAPLSVRLVSGICVLDLPAKRVQE